MFHSGNVCSICRENPKAAMTACFFTSDSGEECTLVGGFLHVSSSVTIKLNLLELVG